MSTEATLLSPALPPFQNPGGDEFLQMANYIPQLAWIADASGWLYWYNQRWYDYTGTTLKDIEGWEWKKIHHPDHVDRVEAKFKKHLITGEDWEDTFPLRSKDGDYRWFLSRAFPIRDAEGRITRWFGTNTDVTEQLEAEQALAESKNAFHDMANSINQMIWVTRPDGYHEYFNKRWYEYTGVPEGSTNGEAWNGMFHAEDQPRAWERWNHSLNTGESYEIEYRLRRHDGVFRWALGRAEPVRDRGGKIVKWYGTCTDIQELVDARHKAEAANIAKSEFLANISHEIRTPMNAVIGLANILARTEPLTSAQNKYIETLQFSAESLLGLLNDMLDIAKIEAQTIELEHIPFFISQMLKNVTDVLAHKAEEKGLEFSIDMTECDDHAALGDPARLQQVLINLCSNAIKFTETGSVRIHVHCKKSDATHPRMVTFEVKDTGIGIPPHKMETIFQKFMQADSSINRKYGGTGLGLAISKSLTELMGGTLSVESTPKVGSTFTVDIPLPIAPEEAVTMPTDHHASTPAQNTEEKGKILLVEDYPANIMVATLLLESMGYAFDVASNGFDALQKIKDNQYATVLMDVQMPGMDGFETTKQVREHEAANGIARTRIIGMTAHALVGDRERCIDCGMDDYISKPFNPDVLEEKLAQAA